MTNLQISSLDCTGIANLMINIKEAFLTMTTKLNNNFLRNKLYLNDLKTTNEKYLPLANFSFASFTTSNDLITISGKVINRERNNQYKGESFDKEIKLNADGLFRKHNDCIRWNLQS
jgi:hypothetical protein